MTPLRWLCLLLIVVSLTLILSIVPYQVDDAYISYRYAANWARGAGPTYNIGQPPVEGFSSPLWVMGLALVARAGGSDALPFFGAVAGLLSFLASLWVVGAAAAPPRSARGEPWAFGPSLVSIGLFALLPTAIAYAVTGLETLLFAGTVALFAAAAAGALPLGWGLAAGALALWVRPEGAWFPIALIVQIVAMRGLRGLRERRAIHLGLAVVLGGAALLAFRLAIFGDLLPNTFYAKQPSLLEGMHYAATFLLSAPLLGLLTCGLIGALLGGPEHRGYFACGLAWAAAAVLEGGDWMPGGRMLLPALTLVTMASAGVIAARHHPRWRAGLVGLLVLAALGGETLRSRELAGSAARAFESYRLEERALADWVGRSGARSVGLIDIGEMGYRTGIGIVDLAGLTDRRIGHAFGRHMEKAIDLTYLFEQRAPDLLIVRLSRMPPPSPEGAPVDLSSVSPADAMSPIEIRVLADSRLRRDYEPLFLQAPEAPRTPLNARLVFVRRGAALSESAAGVRGLVVAQSSGSARSPASRPGLPSGP